MSERFDIKIISTEAVGQIYDRANNRLKPFAAAYFPKEILEVAGWDENTLLTLTAEKGLIQITQNESGEELLYTNDLTYEPVEDES